MNDQPTTSPTTDTHPSPLVSLSHSSPSSPPRSPTPLQPTLDSKADDAPINPNSSPAELVEWGLARFADQPMVLTSSFGMEGCALIDLCSKTIEKLGLEKLTIASIDTGFFFPETKQLRDKLIAKYTNLDFVTWQSSVSVQQQGKLYGDALWKNNPNMCCHIRKIEPMRENITNYQLWITALRRSQTKQRANTEIVSWDWQYQLLKFCPIAAWSRADVWQYIQSNDVPFNQLHLQNYPSVSCFHCTQPVPGSSPDSDARQGRWEGTDKNECGLHFSI